MLPYVCIIAIRIHPNSYVTHTKINQKGASALDAPFFLITYQAVLQPDPNQ